MVPMIDIVRPDAPGEPHVELHRDGSVRGRGRRLGDMPEGYWEWFRLDGTIMRSGHFERGEQVGEWITYNRQGQPHKITRKG
jgi:antitoxin component YwqK of YwqJK toxin-antitoxin module